MTARNSERLGLILPNDDRVLQKKIQECEIAGVGRDKISEQQRKAAVALFPHMKEISDVYLKFEVLQVKSFANRKLRQAKPASLDQAISRVRD